MTRGWYWVRVLNTRISLCNVISTPLFRYMVEKVIWWPTFLLVQKQPLLKGCLGGNGFYRCLGGNGFCRVSLILSDTSSIRILRETDTYLVLSYLGLERRISEIRHIRTQDLRFCRVDSNVGRQVSGIQNIPFTHFTVERYYSWSWSCISRRP